MRWHNLNAAHAGKTFAELNPLDWTWVLYSNVITDVR